MADLRVSGKFQKCENRLASQLMPEQLRLSSGNPLNPPVGVFQPCFHFKIISVNVTDVIGEANGARVLIPPLNPASGIGEANGVRGMWVKDGS